MEGSTVRQGVRNCTASFKTDRILKLAQLLRIFFLTGSATMIRYIRIHHMMYADDDNLP